MLAARRGYAAPHPLYPAREIKNKVRIVRAWPFALGRKNRLLRIADALMLNFCLALKLFFLGRFDVVVAMTSPPLVGFAAALYAKVVHAKFVYWMMDVNPDEAIEAGWIKRGSLRARLLEASLKTTLDASALIIVLDRYMKDRIAQKGINPEKIEVLPPWSHDAFESIPHEANPFRVKHNLQNKFVVMYSGNHSICHPLDTLLDAALHLRNDAAVVFMFIGGGERVRDVLEFKARHSLENILYLPYQSRADIQYSLSAADLHTVVMGNPYAGIVHPSKIYGILHTGRAFVLIGPGQSPIGDLIRRAGAGYQVNHGETENLTAVIREVKNLSGKTLEEISKKEKTLAEQFKPARICDSLERRLNLLEKAA